MMARLGFQKLASDERAKNLNKSPCLLVLQVIPRGLASPLLAPGIIGVASVQVCFFTDFCSVFNLPPCTWRVHGPGRGAARQGKCSSCYGIRVRVMIRVRPDPGRRPGSLSLSFKLPLSRFSVASSN